MSWWRAIDSIHILQRWSRVWLTDDSFPGNQRVASMREKRVWMEKCEGQRSVKDGCRAEEGGRGHVWGPLFTPKKLVQTAGVDCLSMRLADRTSQSASGHSEGFILDMMSLLSVTVSFPFFLNWCLGGDLMKHIHVTHIFPLYHYERVFWYVMVSLSLFKSTHDIPFMPPR